MSDRPIIAYSMMKDAVERLGDVVNEAMGRDWQPYGSPFFIQEGSDNYSKWITGIQVMVRYG